jgi:hypothetical protein
VWSTPQPAPRDVHSPTVYTWCSAPALDTSWLLCARCPRICLLWGTAQAALPWQLQAGTTVRRYGEPRVGRPGGVGQWLRGLSAVAPGLVLGSVDLPDRLGSRGVSEHCVRVRCVRTLKHASSPLFLAPETASNSPSPMGASGTPPNPLRNASGHAPDESTDMFRVSALSV